MLLYGLITVTTIALAYMVKEIPVMTDRLSSRYALRMCRQDAVNRVVITAIFTVLFLAGALRLEVGNDYGTYVVTCHEIFQRGFVVTEPGFNLVVRILYTLSGKEDYLLMFAVFAAAIAAVFLKVIKDGSDSFFLSFFMFMTMGIYFRTYNTVRYYFALALAIYSIRYLVDITKERFIKFLLLILFAATFHKSVLIVIPMYLIAMLPWSKWMYILMAAATVVTPFFGRVIMDIALRLYPSYRNTVYIEQEHTVLENLPVVIGCAATLFLCFICYKDGVKNRRDNKMYFHMCIMAIALYIGCYFLPLVTRLGYYLVTPMILLVPNVICSVRDENQRRRLKLVTCVVCAIYFLYFLTTADEVGVRVLPYKSFLFHDRYWLNQTDTF